MIREGLSIIASLIYIHLVIAYLISVWVLIIILQTSRPDLYKRLENPSENFSPFEIGTWYLSLFIITGYPEPSARGIRGSVWATRVLLIVNIWILLDSRPILWFLDRFSK